MNLVFSSMYIIRTSTVKLLNFRMPENFINLKFIQQGQRNLRVLHQKDANGKANSEDPDQAAPLGLHCLPRLICPKT